MATHFKHGACASNNFKCLTLTPHKSSPIVGSNFKWESGGGGGNGGCYIEAGIQSILANSVCTI